MAERQGARLESVFPFGIQGSNPCPGASVATPPSSTSPRYYHTIEASPSSHVIRGRNGSQRALVISCRFNSRTDTAFHVGSIIGRTRTEGRVRERGAVLLLDLHRRVGRDPAIGVIRISESEIAALTHHHFVSVFHDDPDNECIGIEYGNGGHTRRGARSKNLILTIERSTVRRSRIPSRPDSGDDGRTGYVPLWTVSRSVCGRYTLVVE